MSDDLEYARYRYKKVDDGDSVVDSDDEWVDICKLLDGRVADLQAQLERANGELREWSEVCGIGGMSLKDSRDYVESLHQAARMRKVDRATEPRADDMFGDPLTNAEERIKELLSMFKCRSCYDKGWVVGIEGASPLYGMGGSNECQESCPDCSPTEQAQPRPMSEAPRTGEVLVLARMTSKHTITFDALGWLPTSSGEEGESNG